MRGHTDLRTAVAAAVLCAVLALVLPFGALRLVFAAPLAFFLPGYAIASAAFARRPLARPKLLLLSVGLSLAVLALGALILNYVPGGIRAGSWALLLILVVLGASRAAAIARPAGDSSSLPRPRFSPKRGEAALLGAGMVAGIAAIVLAFQPMSAKDAVGYSEMWIQPFDGNRSSGVQIGVGNRMQQRGFYLLRVRFGGEDGKMAVRSFTLEPGEDEVLRLPAAARPSGKPLPVVATLFRPSRSDRPYRRVSDWIVAPEDAG